MRWICPDPGGELDRERAIDCTTRPCECLMQDFYRWQAEKKERLRNAGPPGS